MLTDYIQLIVTLGVFTIIILLLIILPLLFSIRKLQKQNIEALDNATKSVEKFNTSVSEIQYLITNNFKNAFDKVNILDSRQLSIYDYLKDMSSNINMYSTKAIDLITANKPVTKVSAFKAARAAKKAKGTNSAETENKGL